MKPDPTPGTDHNAMVEFDMVTGERTLHVYAPSTESPHTLAVFWHHGTPNVGNPPAPLLEASHRLGIRWVSHDRPGYGGSSPDPRRTIASVAADIASIADRLEISRFAVMGHSGGGPHALACAALLPDRVAAVVSGSGLAPFDAAGLDWFAGMHPAGEAELKAAVSGKAALLALLESAEFDPGQFTSSDHRALAGDWAWLGEVAGKGLDSGWDGMLDDDLAYVSSWGFDPGSVDVPVLLMHGDEDRIVPPAHGRWLAERIAHSELWLGVGDGHISIMQRGEDALEWLLDQAGDS
jgi:pimeloyl-ACP methyl ester carboxylesterase